jgi:alkylated DNA repair protein (DNA oxidative demethylase)
MLFPDYEPALPQGFQYLPDWISQIEERSLLDDMARLNFSDVRMHGVVAKRRVVHFGWDYGYESWRISRTDAAPDWLMPLRARAAALIDEPAEALEEVLVTRYEPGAGIGWHRDAPMFGPVVVGVSLLSVCRMRFQWKQGAERKTAACLLAPRSAYVLRGAARDDWQHSIPPVNELRYSITFRTVKASR